MASVIPERPLRVHPQFARRMRTGFVVMALLGLLPTAAALFIIVDGISSIVSDRRVWDAGKRGNNVSVRDRTKVKVVFVNYKLEASWVDDAGASHSGTADWNTLVGVAEPAAGLRLVRLCAARSDVVECTVVSLKRVEGKQGPTGWATLRLRARQPNARIRKQKLYVRDVGPLYADEAKTLVYALVSPSAPDRPLAVAADLYPFAPNV